MSLGIIILRIQEGLDYADFFGSLRHSIIDMDDLTTNTADNNNINNTNSNGNMNIKLFQIPEKNDDDDDDIYAILFVLNTKKNFNHLGRHHHNVGVK